MQIVKNSVLDISVMMRKAAHAIDVMQSAEHVMDLIELNVYHATTITLYLNLKIL